MTDTPHWLPRRRETFTREQLAREAQSRSLYHRGKEVTLPSAPWEQEEVAE